MLDIGLVLLFGNIAAWFGGSFNGMLNIYQDF